MKTLVVLALVAAGSLSACVVAPIDDGRAYPSQQRYSRDRDRDGIPDRYDRDRDGDGVPNRVDRRPDNPRR